MKGQTIPMEEVIPQRLTDTFRTIFGNQDIHLTRETTANDVAGWDSLMHINLIVAVEKEFRVRFTTLEVMSLNNVGDLADTITRKVKKE
jgi:acyl carrier protein